jgi:hypothetical protein
MNCRDFGIWYDAQSVPAFTENAHQATRLTDIDVAGLIDRMSQEQVTREHGNSDEVPFTRSLRPDVDSG